MRVVLADPPAYTPPYDHALAAALGRAGADVELLTSRFRFGPRPAPVGYELSESLYPLSARIRGRARLPVKAVEHPLALARLGLTRADVLHVQWVAAPEVDTWLLHRRGPLVFTAHDLLPRRTASRAKAWRRLFHRFDRIVVHSDNGRRALASFGVDETKLRVIPHPVFHGPVERRDDGRTALMLGVLRPYKGLPDAVTAVLGVDEARLLVAGDPRESIDAERERLGARGEWRLGWFSDGQLAEALAETTVALFPYRPELDQSGALLQSLGHGVPAIVYDVGGIGEVVRTYGAGRVVPAGDVNGLTTALRELLGSGEALAAARAGAERARQELTWDASARAHLELYEELT